MPDIDLGTLRYKLAIDTSALDSAEKRIGAFGGGNVGGGATAVGGISPGANVAANPAMVRMSSPMGSIQPHAELAGESASKSSGRGGGGGWGGLFGARNMRFALFGAWDIARSINAGERAEFRAGVQVDTLAAREQILSGVQSASSGIGAIPAYGLNIIGRHTSLASPEKLEHSTYAQRSTRTLTDQTRASVLGARTGAMVRGARGGRFTDEADIDASIAEILGKRDEAAAPLNVQFSRQQDMLNSGMVKNPAFRNALIESLDGLRESLDNINKNADMEVAKQQNARRIMYGSRNIEEGRMRGGIRSARLRTMEQDFAADINDIQTEGGADVATMLLTGNASAGQIAARRQLTNALTAEKQVARTRGLQYTANDLDAENRAGAATLGRDPIGALRETVAGKREEALRGLNQYSHFERSYNFLDERVNRNFDTQQHLGEQAINDHWRMVEVSQRFGLASSGLAANWKPAQGAVADLVGNVALREQQMVQMGRPDLIRGVRDIGINQLQSFRNAYVADFRAVNVDGINGLAGPGTASGPQERTQQVLESIDRHIQELKGTGLITP